MPNLSLRAYEKQIENLIEENRIDEAIEHCQQILRSYPKCISTYRILGKALLEGKRYDESADVFERVLTVFPDDYIAHVGMSIIQENNGNLDAAIWHMELAFDSQPSNITIQEELKRLLGLRDGTHPAKIRLTRGALVRMYARGELYPQAIAEIKSALTEDSKRVDLKVLLAKMNYLLGDSTEALNLCNQLVSELPFCYEINQILVSLLPGSDKAEKTPIYRDRLQALNPYEAFVGEKYSSDTEVPDDQVTVEQLSEISTGSIPQNSEWVKKMDSKWEEEEPASNETWSPFGNDAAPANPFNDTPPVAEDTQTEAQSIPTNEVPEVNSKGENLPDWMRSAGWLPTNDTAAHDAESQNPFADDQPAQEAESADLPDWLRSLAPEEPETAPSAETDSSTFMTNNDQPAAENSTSEEPAETDLPDWLKSFENENSQTQQPGEELPDWMKSLQSEENQPQAETTNSPFATETTPPSKNEEESVPQKSTNTLPPLFDEEEEAATSPSLPTQESAQEPESDVPDWVRSVMTGPEPTPTEAENEVPDQTQPPTAEESAAAISEKTGDDLLSWLRDLKPEEETGAPLSEETEGSTAEENGNLEDFSSLDRLEHLTEESLPAEQPETSSADAFHSSMLDSLSSEPDIQESTGPVSSEMADSVAPAEPVASPIPEVEPAVVAPEEAVEATETAGNGTSLEHYVEQTQLYPDDFAAWQALGDEYARANEFSKALAAYNKAEELIIHSK